VTLTPRGHLLLTSDDSAPIHAPSVDTAFERGSGYGLLELGATEVGTTLAPELSYWRDFGARFVTAVCAHPHVDSSTAIDPPPPADLDALAAAAPPMTGVEYLTTDVLQSLWIDTANALRGELADTGLSVQAFLGRKNPAWHVVGRVHFNLAENRKDDEAPFAFLATYTTELSARGKEQHLPLGRALSEYAGPANKSRLLSLLLPVKRAAAQCAWLKQLVDAREIYHPLRWTPSEALQLLGDVPILEAAGIVVRVPAAWRGKRPARPRVTGTVGAKSPAGLGAEALLDFNMSISLDGEPLTSAEIEQVLAASNGLHFIRGRWVEIDRSRLQQMLEEFRAVEAAAKTHGLTFAEAVRLLAGANVSADLVSTETRDWAAVVAGPWLSKTLAQLRDPAQLAPLDPGDELKTTLRPYQRTGVQWLHKLSTLGLGACLADDMGLGKTMQVLALLLVLRRRADGDTSPRASILVTPASLLANWAAEIARFAPGLRAVIAHPSAMTTADLKALDRDRAASADLVITSYGTLLRAPHFAAIPWRLAILDEAQAIKTPGAKQTRAVKRLEATARIALTGTPVENRLGDLWSIFDVINPGLLGSPKAFSTFTKRQSASGSNPYGPLRSLVRPYILRRLKTDRSIIDDLPDKTEVKAYCSLTRTQASLYQHAVADLGRDLQLVDGMKRRGIVLASLMRFKQICNHPSQWLGDHAWAETESGKFGRLRELAEVMAEKQEKVLVFTQFRETTAPLASFLGSVFGRPGLVLHGETAVAKRQSLVDQFQEDERVPFFVISLKAGGAGLNLTAASQVIHFDRWWNPAVENQATDRAFRIGQAKNVLVHKFICRGTVEEKIDELIDSKRKLSDDVLAGGGEVLLTEMRDDELLKIVALDVHTALGE
jgi:non-specific serine/threonine protein kinase